MVVKTFLMFCIFHQKHVLCFSFSSDHVFKNHLYLWRILVFHHVNILIYSQAAVTLTIKIVTVLFRCDARFVVMRLDLVQGTLQPVLTCKLCNWCDVKHVLTKHTLLVYKCITQTASWMNSERDQEGSMNTYSDCLFCVLLTFPSK